MGLDKLTPAPSSQGIGAPYPFYRSGTEPRGITAEFVFLNSSDDPNCRNDHSSAATL